MRLITVVQGFLMGLVVFGPWLYPGQFNFSFEALTWYRAVGLAMVVLGAVLFLVAIREMGSSRTWWPKPPKNAKLITTGIFKYTRNPIYVGVILGGYGWSLYQWSIASLLATAVLRFWLTVKISKEEEFLEEQFGEAYIDYANKTSRFIPGVGRG